MLTKLNNFREEHEDAFTLIELLVVILIIGILAAIAIPVFLNQRKTANDAAVESDLKNVASNVETWIAGQKGANIAIGANATSSDVKAGTQFEAVTGAQTTEGVTWKVSGSANGYCILGAHENGKEYKADTPLTYDSVAGGIDRTGGACTGTETLTTSGEEPELPTGPVAGGDATDDSNNWTPPVSDAGLAMIGPDGATIPLAIDLIQYGNGQIDYTATRGDGVDFTDEVAYSFYFQAVSVTCANGQTFPVDGFGSSSDYVDMGTLYGMIIPDPSAIPAGCDQVTAMELGPTGNAGYDYDLAGVFTVTV